MAKQIKRSDIAEDDIFKAVRDSADQTITKLEGINKQFAEMGTNIKTALGKAKFDSTQSINAFMKQTEEANKLTKEQIKLEQELQKAIKLKAQADREVLKTTQATTKATEEQNNAYKQLVKTTRDFKNEAKRLSAELLEMERNGKRGTKEFYELQKQLRNVTKEANAGDKALKKIDGSVGDNFRNVGNYKSALGGLKTGLAQLGLAFGVLEGVRFFAGKELELQRLQLALKNVMGSTEEFNKAFEYLTELSNNYGQDLIVLTDSYKSFIASSNASGLALEERNKIYEAIIKSGSSLALSNEQIQGSLLAVSQMFSKGKVSAEELRGQLGERLPGAFGIMAKAVGVTESELGEMMQKGEVMAKDVLPKFAVELEKTFGANANKNLTTIGGSFNVLRNNIMLYINDANKGGVVTQNIAKGIAFLSRNIESIIGTIGTLIKVFLEFKAVQLALRIKDSIVDWKNFGGAIENASDKVKTFNKSLKSIKFVAIIEAVSMLANQIWRVANGYDVAEQRARSFDRYKKLAEIQSNANIKAIQDEIDANDALLQSQINAGKITEEEAKKRQLEFVNAKQFAKEEADWQTRQVKTVYKSRIDLVKDLIKEENTLKKSRQADINRLSQDPFINRLKIADEKAAIDASNVRIKNYYAYLELLKSGNKELIKEANLTKETTNAKQKNAKAQKELNTEFKETNEYISREIELLKQLQDLEADRAEQWTENLIERELNAQLRSAEMFFEANVDELERLLDVLTNMKIERLKKDTDFELSEIDRKTKYEIEQNRIKLQDERDELIKGGGDKAKIEANYQEKLKELSLEEEKRYRDAELEKKVITEKSAQEVIEIEKDKNEKIEDYNNQVYEALKRNGEKTAEESKKNASEELETRKELMNQINDLVKFSTDYFIEQSQRRIEQIDKELQALEKQADFLEQMAVNGNITAEKSLAVNKKLQAEAQQEREKELKKQERIKLAQSVYDSYSANVASGQQNPVTKTITDIKLLNQFIKSLPTFYEGTETTVSEALGAPQMSGKDGYIVRVDGSEKVLNPELSRMTGQLTTREIAQISEDRLKGRLIYKGEASQIGSAWESQLIVNSLNELKEVVKNKPETTIQASEIIGGVMHIIEARKERNTTVRNIRRIK